MVVRSPGRSPMAGRRPAAASEVAGGRTRRIRGRRSSTRSAGYEPALSSIPARCGRTRLPGFMLPMVHRFIRLKRCAERLRSPSSTDMATSGRFPRDRASCTRLGTASSASGAIPSQRCTGAIRRMSNASVPNSVGSTPWHAVFADYGDLAEATSSSSQARVREAPLAAALDQRHEMTSHRALPQPRIPLPRAARSRDPRRQVPRQLRAPNRLAVAPRAVQLRSAGKRCRRLIGPPLGPAPRSGTPKHRRARPTGPLLAHTVGRY